tara:strand:- start:636 stop:1688 length:1053 start_codon:yes stop_codon:yes gene_type:complete
MAKTTNYNTRYFKMTTISTAPKRYISLIQRELRKDRLAPTNEKRGFMQFIPFLPAELRREIFKFIDIETRISMMLDKRPYLVRGRERLPEETLNAIEKKNPFYSLLNSANFTNIYLNGFVNEIFYYNQRSRRWLLRKELFKLFPTHEITTISSGAGVNLRSESRIITFNNSVHTTLDRFRRKYPVSNAGISARWSEVSSVPICALSLFLKTKDNINTDYYLRKKGLNLMIAIDCLIKTKIQNIRIRKEKARPLIEMNEMFQEEVYTRRYNNRKLKADQRAAKIEAVAAKKQAVATARAQAQSALAIKRIAVDAKKETVARARAEKKAAKEIRNNEIFISNLMGFGSIMNM